MSVPPVGQEASYPLVFDTGYIVRVHHGSSPLLISRVHKFLTEKDEDGEQAFQSFDPKADHDKWSRRGMQLYYVAVVDPCLGEIVCALRAVTEGIIANPNIEPVAPGSKKRKLDSSRRRILVDYLYTIPEAQKEGIAGLLVPQVLGLAQGGPCYVASLPESYVYWRNKHHFGPCSSPGLNELMNLFRDIVLLRRDQLGQEDGREEEVVVEDDCYQRARLKRCRCSSLDLGEQLWQSVIIPSR